jgi:hypothetical protein
MKKFHLYLASIFMILATVVSLNGFAKTSQAAGIDDTRDCDNTAIIHCGVMTMSELKTKYAANEAGDLPAIYKAFGVTNFDGMVDGVVWRDGRVTVGSETVATGAMTAARNMSGGAIAGSDAKVISPSVWPAEFISAKPAYVKMVNGQFVYAVLKTCGNPVKATPKPKPAAACNAVSVATISRTEYEFTGTATTSNGATVSGYVFTVKNSAGAVVKTVTVNTTALSAKSGKVTLPTAGNYSVSLTVKTSLGDKTGANCAKQFTVPPAPVTPTAVCVNIHRSIISKTDSKFTGVARTTGSATVSGYVFTVKNSSGATVKTSTVNTTALTAVSDTISLTPGTYTANVTVKTSLGNKTDAVCNVTFTIPKPEEAEVCNPATGKTMVVAKDQESKYKPVGDIACSTVKVCDETTKTIIEVPYKDKDNYKPVSDAACKEAPLVEGVSVIASTGPTDLIGGGIGLSSLAAAGYYFRASRRSVIDALRNR